MSSLGESTCALCRNEFTALPALSRALENHHMWCDPRAFCERLKEARKEDVERGHKSPKFEVCVVAAAANDDARSKLISFDASVVGVVDDDRDMADVVLKALEETECGAMFEEMRMFDASAGEGVAAFHACCCPSRTEVVSCGELASRPVVCQQCGTLYERAHADALTAKAGEGNEWCFCGGTRPPTRVIFSLKEDIESAYPKDFVDASRKRCDQALAECLVALEREAELKANVEGDVDDVDAKDETVSTSTRIDVGGARTLVFDHETFTHFGVGCDFCGVYPIVGPRYQCAECKDSEFMGFDLCAKCMQNVFEHPERKRDYRFAQNHTDAHEMVLVRPRPTMVHVMKSLHPELSANQIIQWLDNQATASREAEAEAAEDEAQAAEADASESDEPEEGDMTEDEHQ